MVFWIPPRSGVLIWTMSQQAASVKSRTSSKVLHHSSATILTEEPRRRAAPFFGTVHSRPDAESLPNLPEKLNLPGLFLGVDRPFDVQRELGRILLERGEVIGHSSRVEPEDLSDRPVDVDMEGRTVGGFGPERADPVGQPADVRPKQLPVPTELFVDVVDQGVGQDVHAFEDHLVGVDVAVVPGLAEDGDALGDDREIVFLADDLGHEPVTVERPGLEEGLGQSVADGGMEPHTVEFQVFDLPGHRPERSDLPPFEQRPDARLEQGQVIRGQEERIAPSGSGILNRGAIPSGDGSVLQDEENGQDFSGHPDGLEMGRGRLPGVKKSVVAGPGLDGPLVVEIEGGRPGHEQRFDNFHFGLPISLLLLMA